MEGIKQRQTALAVWSLLSGYCFDGSPKDDRYLSQFGIRRLTANRDVFENKIETPYDKMMARLFPDGPAINNSDDEFIVEKDGVQMAVLIHGGQWFVGFYYWSKTYEGYLSSEDIKATGKSSPCERDTYEVVTWPDVQLLMDLDGFYENSYLVNDDAGMKDFGSSAYFVNTKWLKHHEL